MVSSFSHPIRSSIKSLSDMATLHLNYSFYRPTMMALEQCHPKNNHLRAKFNCIKVNLKVIAQRTLVYVHAHVRKGSLNS